MAALAERKTRDPIAMLLRTNASEDEAQRASETQERAERRDAAERQSSLRDRELGSTFKRILRISNVTVEGVGGAQAEGGTVVLEFAVSKRGDTPMTASTINGKAGGFALTEYEERNVA